jgi:hypothetical protein
LLDGILDNHAEPPIERHTADAARYSDLVCTLFDLLEPPFAPRRAGLRNTALAERAARRAAVWDDRDEHLPVHADARTL